MQNRILLSSPHMGGNELKYVNGAFDKNWIAPMGENVNEFENDVKQFLGGDTNTLALSSGTSAIHLALIEAGVKEDDVVFCSSLTFSASANPILYLKATPVFIDSETETWNMDPDALEAAFKKYEQLGKKPKAVIVVNLYGQTAKYDEIRALCEQYGVPIVEDSAESLGSIYKGQKSGTLGDLSIFSFNGNKIITTSGGGMLVTKNKQAIEHALFLATQAREKAIHYQHKELGFNYRLSNISAGIGRGQMEVLQDRVEERRAIFNQYKENLEQIQGLQFQTELPDTYSNRWLTALTIDAEQTGFSSLDLIKELDAENIEARPVWKPMHLQPLYEKFDYITVNNDNAKTLYDNGVCLPSGSNMTQEELNKVIDVILHYVNNMKSA